MHVQCICYELHRALHSNSHELKHLTTAQRTDQQYKKNLKIQIKITDAGLISSNEQLPLGKMKWMDHTIARSFAT